MSKLNCPICKAEIDCSDDFYLCINCGNFIDIKLKKVLSDDDWINLPYEIRKKLKEDFKVYEYIKKHPEKIEKEANILYNSIENIRLAVIEAGKGYNTQKIIQEMGGFYLYNKNTLNKQQKEMIKYILAFFLDYEDLNLQFQQIKSNIPESMLNELTNIIKKTI